MQSPIVRSFLERSERSPLGLFGLDAPSGGDRLSLKRDLTDGKRVLLRRPTVYEVRAIDKKAREVEVVASTSGVKRDGNAIFHSEKAWDFRNFEKNPAMLWSHDYGSAFAPPGLPLGYWKTWGIDKTKAGNALVMRGWFEEDEFPEKVWRRILSGTIRAVSIGWNPIEFEELEDEKGRQVGWNFTLNELYECSWVVIGADPDAGVRGMYADLNAEELDVIANGRRAHELSRGVAYMLDHRDAPEEFVRSIVNLPKEEKMKRASAPNLTLGDRVRVKDGREHDKMTKGASGEIVEISSPALGIKFDGMNEVHRWYVEAEVERLESTLGSASPVEEPSDPEKMDPEMEMAVAGTAAPEVRVGKKMATKRLATLKKCREHLDEVIKECEDEECDPEKMDPEMEMAVAGTAAPEVRAAPDPETRTIDPNEALRDLSQKLARTVEQEKRSRYVSAVLGDLVADLTKVVS